MSETFNVLVVCIGNLCRSPLAERLLRHRLAETPDVEVTSAGVRAVVGAPMDASAALELSRLGGDPTGFVARPLTADLVTANREKLADVPALRVLLQSDDSILEPLGIQGTPGAVLVGTDGRLIGPPAHGTEPIRLMHLSMVNSLAGAGASDGHDHVHQIEQRPVSQGEAAPEAVALATESGEEWPTEDAFADDPVLLFWRFDCGFCAQIVDQVREIEGRLPLRIVTTSTTEAIRTTGLISPIVRDLFSELESWLHVPGTPSAARVRDGVLASDMLVGGPEVLALLQSVASESALRD